MSRSVLAAAFLLGASAAEACDEPYALDGVGIGDTRAEVRTRLGTPDRVDGLFKGESDWVYEPHLEISFTARGVSLDSEQVVVDVRTQRRSSCVVRGVCVDENRARVMRALGEPRGETQSEDGGEMEYALPGFETCWLSVWLSGDGTVERIGLRCQP